MTTTATRGTAKTLRESGIDFNSPFIYGGNERKQLTDGSDYHGICGKRFERIEASARGVFIYDADNKGFCVGGTAVKFWVTPVVEAPHASEVDAAEVDGLEALTFPQLMEIAKQLKVRGRGTARKPQLVEGIRAARAAA